MNRHTFLSVILPLALQSACSLTLSEPTACTVDTECRSTFGQGSVCEESGYCAILAPGPRCQLYPESLSLPVNPETTLLLGSLFNLGNETHNARSLSARLVVDQFNLDNVLAGQKAAIMECSNEVSSNWDDLNQDDATTALTRYLSEDLGVAAIIGPSSSGRVTLAYSVAAPMGTLIISPSATSISLTALDGAVSTDDNPGLLWRTAAPDNAQGEAIAQDMAARGVRTVSVIYRSGTYEDSLATAIYEAYLNIGTTTPYPFSTATARDTTINTVGELDTDEVIFISSEISDISVFLLMAAELESYSTVGIFLTDSAANQDLLNAVSAAQSIFDQIRISKPFEPEGNIYNTFANSYSAAYNGADVQNYSYTAHTHDATWLALYGAAWSLYEEGEIYGKGIARGLRHISAGETVELGPSDWNYGIGQFRLGLGIDVIGASGELDYDPETGETRATIGVLIISEDGQSFIPAP